ncbi:kelch repeat-containing family protein [Striga asiatica]|uniref:Kelch repeat-containing family protein n=1 Tax=Striga asiatica TaxID=4170 RepID=A0A5A7R3E0_STRAF|nr:kelch repeat-containing family protein [Striga asiatica]
MSSAGKYSFTKCTVIFSFLCLLAIATTLHFHWASLSSVYLSSIASTQKNHVVLVPRSANVNQPQIEPPDNEQVHNNVNHMPERVLSATFADLSAPELNWEQMPTAPVPRLDGSAVQIKNLLYVFSGYGTLDYVHSHVDIYNFTDNTWSGRFDTPKEMANSHLGMACDGRYVYIVSGQYGPQCRAPTTRSFVLDTKTRKWKDFLSLPSPRYAAATQIWKGRLHVMGGSKENRHTPGTDHWSIAVKNGKALENQWRTETPIPRGGPHRACVAVGDRLFVVYGDVYMLDVENKWKVLAPMPKPDSHIESSWILHNNSIIIMGGTTEKNPVTKRMILVGEVFQLHLNTLQWSVIGRLPYRIKTTLAGFWDGYIYFTSGQRDRGPDNPQPRKVVGEMWRTKLSSVI